MSVLYCKDIELASLQSLLDRYGMDIKTVNDNGDIPGSFWKDSEAGLIGNILYVRDDTPVHSALHEACHYICMDQQRREQLNTDAGGGFEEEDGVCFLQILLADQLDTMGKERMFKDMDEWGYSFRLGSAKAWFEKDAEDAQQWLIHHKLINTNNLPTWNLRTH